MVLGINDKDFLDSTKIKVIDSIAGAGKSTSTHNYLYNNGIKYQRLTSTNALKRDAEDRYNMKCQTVASGLFKNEYGHFYSEFKDPECSTVVIDEILQTNPKAIEWCNAYVGKCNIIVTTDSKQLLAPEAEESMLSSFRSFIKQDNVIYSCITETKRARNEETAKAFSNYYALSESPILYDVNSMSSMFTTVKYSDIEYNTNDVYITHTKNIEDFLYKDKLLSSRSDLDLIPKGSIASKAASDFSCYPILSQLSAEASNARAYTQIKNIGTPTRYQGSEVVSGSHLYFMVSPESKVSARELYTVITRLWCIEDLVLVICEDVPDQSEIKKFKNLPVKHLQYAKCDYEGETKFMSTTRMRKFMEENFPDTDDIYFDKNVVYGKNYKGNHAVAYAKTGYNMKTYDPKYRYKITAGSLARKDGSLNYSYVPAIYRELEERGLNSIPSVHKLNPFSGARYQVDMFSAYPTIMKHAALPCDGLLKFEPSDDLMNFYICKAKGFTPNSIIEDSLAQYIVDNDLGEVEYIFSTPKKVGCYPGEYLFDMAHKSQEAKKSIKEIHYGYYQKPYLSLSEDKSCYIINEKYKYEILMAAICSILCYNMCKVLDAIDGKYVRVDAVYFESYDDDTINKINNACEEWFEWRILDNETKNEVRKVLYQNYETVKTAREIKTDKQRTKRANMTEEEKETDRAKNREQQRNRRANMTEEEKEAARAKDRERKRLARLAKKNQV